MFIDDMGCSVNVITFMDKKCSGKQMCDYKVGDELFDLKPCASNVASLLSYLEVSYKCVEGTLSFSFFLTNTGNWKC